MITVVGDVMADVVAGVDGPLARGSDTPATVMLRGGGAAGNVAAWLGGRARLVARVGDDAMATVALDGLRGAVVDPALPTGVCVVIVGPDGERTMLPDPGANAVLDPPPGPIDAQVVYVSGYALMRESTRAGARAWLAAARGRTAVDPASAALIAVTPEAFEDLHVDLLLPNEDEAAVLGERCFAIAREVVVKRGAAGAEWSDGARVLRTGPAASTVLDTTGAGDAFAAGFLAAWAEGPERALEAGTACAGRALAGPGSRP